MGTPALCFLSWMGRGALRLFGGAGPGRRDRLAAALELEPAQRKQDGTHGEPAQQL
jgi:hypothetical protein